MTQGICTVKKQLDKSIAQLCEVSWKFSKNPEQAFTQTRKPPFRKMISFVLAMEGGTLASEMLNHFGCSPDIASVSALPNSLPLLLFFITLSVSIPIRRTFLSQFR